MLASGEKLMVRLKRFVAPEKAGAAHHAICS
jgi:hypothetical protein